MSGLWSPRRARSSSSPVGLARLPPTDPPDVTAAQLGLYSSVARLLSLSVPVFAFGCVSYYGCSLYCVCFILLLFRIYFVLIFWGCPTPRYDINYRSHVVRRSLRLERIYSIFMTVLNCKHFPKTIYYLRMDGNNVNLHLYFMNPKITSGFSFLFLKLIW